jgi:hypothetical protein
MTFEGTSAIICKLAKKLAHFFANVKSLIINKMPRKEKVVNGQRQGDQIGRTFAIGSLIFPLGLFDYTRKLKHWATLSHKMLRMYMW